MTCPPPAYRGHDLHRRVRAAAALLAQRRQHWHVVRLMPLSVTRLSATQLRSANPNQPTALQGVEHQLDQCVLEMVFGHKPHEPDDKRAAGRVQFFSDVVLPARVHANLQHSALRLRGHLLPLWKLPLRLACQVSSIQLSLPLPGPQCQQRAETDGSRPAQAAARFRVHHLQTALRVCARRFPHQRGVCSAVATLASLRAIQLSGSRVRLRLQPCARLHRHSHVHVYDYYLVSSLALRQRAEYAVQRASLHDGLKHQDPRLHLCLGASPAAPLAVTIDNW